MKAFEYVEPGSLRGVAERMREVDRAVALAGGMDLIGLMKDHIAAPDRLVSLKGVTGLDSIEPVDGGLQIGALTTLSRIASSKTVHAHYAALAQAAASVGTPQIRNRGTLGGNLCQRPRCWYFRSEEFHCLKKGGDACFAQAGDNRYHAIFANHPCAIVHPSSCAPALIALGATATIGGPDGERTLAVEDMFVLPEFNIASETVLGAGEIVLGVTLPAAEGWTSAIEVIKARASYDWPLAIACAAIRRQGDQVAEARVVLGAVAPVPWRSPEAERALIGSTAGEAAALAAAEAALADATPMDQNGYKTHVAAAAVRRAILAAATA